MRGELPGAHPRSTWSRRTVRGLGTAEPLGLFCLCPPVLSHPGFRGAAALAQRRRLRPVRPCLFYFFLKPRPETTDTGRQRAVLLAGVVETAAATGTVSASSDEPPPYPSRSRRALPSRALFPRAPGRPASEVKRRLEVNSTLRAVAATVSAKRPVRRCALCGEAVPRFSRPLPAPRGDDIRSTGVSCLAPTPAPRGAGGLSEPRHC